MNELTQFIEVNFEKQTVSARSLYKKLEVKYDFNRWVEINFKQFIENKDYFGGHIDVRGNQYGGSITIVDYDLTINMAEHLCLMSNTEKGYECRDYLLKLYEAWNTPEMVFARAVKFADRQIAELNNRVYQLETDVERMKPKEEFFDAVTDSKDAIPIADVAKDLGFKGIGRNNLFKILREERILQPNNIPYQEYIDRGYFRVVEQRYDKPYGEVGINIKTLVFQKGIDFIRKLLINKGYV